MFFFPYDMKGFFFLKLDMKGLYNIPNKQVANIGVWRVHLSSQLKLRWAY